MFQCNNTKLRLYFIRINFKCIYFDIVASKEGEAQIESSADDRCDSNGASSHEPETEQPATAPPLGKCMQCSSSSSSSSSSSIQFLMTYYIKKPQIK